MFKCWTTNPATSGQPADLTWICLNWFETWLETCFDKASRLNGSCIYRFYTWLGLVLVDLRLDLRPALTRFEIWLWLVLTDFNLTWTCLDWLENWLVMSFDKALRLDLDSLDRFNTELGFVSSDLRLDLNISQLTGDLRPALSRLHTWIVHISITFILDLD